MELYENIKHLRESHGMSQETLAEKTGYKDRSSIAKIEAGKVDLTQSKIAAFAKVFDVSPAELMGFEETPAPLILSDEEQMLIYCWRQATPEIRENIAFSLRYYGMPKPQVKKEDGLSISHGA